MSLEQGDYLIVGEKIVQTLLSDTAPGGLCEENNPAVKTIEPRIRRESKLYSKYELPLIGVEVVGKREEPAPSSQLIDKIFELEFLILCRGGDREAEVERAKKIAHRLEKVLIEQNRPDKQFLGLGKEISPSQGILILELKETRFESRFFQEAFGSKPEVACTVSAELIIPSSREL